MKEISKLKELLKEATSQDYAINKVIKSLDENKVADTIEQTNPELAAIEKAQAVKKIERYSAQENDAEAKREQAQLNLRKKMITPTTPVNASVEQPSTLVHDDSIVPIKKDEVTVIKFGSKHDSTDKEQLEPSVKAPDPAIDPGFDGPANDLKQVPVPTIQPMMDINNKEENNMEKKNVIIAIEESMNDLFKILKEEDSEEPMVGMMPPVVSPAAEVEMSDEEPSEMEEVKSEETVEVAADVQPEVTVTDTSIKIEIPVSSSEEVASEVSEESAEALKEAFRVVYGILSGKPLNEEESVEVPMDAEAEVKVEADKIVIEIPVEKPVDEISEEQNEKLQEALSVISYILKEELGDAAAEPVHTDEAPEEHTPEVDNEDILVGQHAEEVEEVIVEGTEPHQEDQMLDDKGELVDVEDKVLPEVKAGEIVIPAHDHADAEGKKVRDAIHEELGDAAAEPVHTDTAAKEHTPEVDNDDILVGQHAEEVEEVIVESEETVEVSTEPKVELEVEDDKLELEIQTKKGEESSESEETVEVSTDVKPEVMVSSDTIRIEIPVDGKELSSEVSEEKMEELKESLRRIHTIFSSRLNEEESVEVPMDAEADVKVEGDKLVIEIPVESPKEVISSEESKEVESEVQKISESLLGDAAAEPVHTDAAAKEHTPEVANKDILVGQHAEEVEEVIVEAAKAKLIASKKSLVKKAEKPVDKSSYASVNSSFDFDTDAALYLLKEFKLSRDKKVQIVSEAAAQLFVEDTKSLIEQSGFALTQTGFKKFLESQKAKLTEEEENHLFKEIKGNSVSEKFKKEELGKGSEDIVSDEVNNKKRLDGKYSEDVNPVLVESETKLPEPSDAVKNQYDVEAALKVSMNPVKAEKEEEIVVAKAEQKAQPKDVTEAVQYKSLKEAFLLEANYFEKESFAKVTPEEKKEKLSGQLSLLIARESNDPLYEELVKTTAFAKQLQEEISKKYNKLAKEKSTKLVETLSKKESGSSQASSLSIVEFLYNIENNPDLLNEGLGSWIKGKFLLMSVNMLPENALNTIIMKAHTKAMSLAKTPEQRKIVEGRFTTTFADKKSKITFIKGLIKEAPESEMAKADQKLKSVASSVAAKAKSQQISGQSLNASLEYIEENFFSLFENEIFEELENLNEDPRSFMTLADGGSGGGGAAKAGINSVLSATQAAGYSAVDGRAWRPPTISATQAAGYSLGRPAEAITKAVTGAAAAPGFLAQAGAALMASGPLSLIAGIIAGLVIAGVMVLVNKLIQKISASIADARENSY
jgi:hypothetical protein